MRVALVVLLALISSASFALAPLESKAPAWAKSVQQGAVATAEKREGQWHYGIAGEPFDQPSTVQPKLVLFEIGSISKVFTGLLLAHAVHDGKLGLDDTLAQRLPVKFAKATTGAITLKQLATHTSCLPRLPSNLTSAAAADPYADYDETKLFAYLSYAETSGTPPCKSDYSNLGFGILGVVVARAYGKPWDELVRDKITKPLGMIDTAQTLDADQTKRFALAWAGAERASPWTFQAIAGAGALRSTTADMARFADALLAGAKGPLKDVWPIFAGDYVDMPMTGAKMGLGLMHTTSNGVESYGHEGGTGGYRSALQVYPASGTAMVVLASNDKAEPQAWIAQWRNADAPKVARTEVAMDEAALADYPGVYALAAQARLTVLKVGKELRVRLTGQPFIAVYPSAKDEFFYKVVDAQLSFARDADGKIKSVTLHQNGRDMLAERNADPVPMIEFPPAAALAEYAGEYDFAAFQPGVVIKVMAKGDVLGAQLTGQGPAPIFNVGKDRFEWDIVVAALSFERDAKGKIVAAVLHQNGADMRAPRK